MRHVPGDIRHYVLCLRRPDQNSRTSTMKPYAGSDNAKFLLLIEDNDPRNIGTPSYERGEFRSTPERHEAKARVARGVL